MRSPTSASCDRISASSSCRSTPHSSGRRFEHPIDTGEKRMRASRRKALQGMAAGAAASVLGFPAIGQGRAKVKLGYLHTPAVDGQIWTRMQMGSFGKAGVDLELVQFTT